MGQAGQQCEMTGRVRGMPWGVFQVSWTCFWQAVLIRLEVECSLQGAVKSLLLDQLALAFVARL